MWFTSVFTANCLKLKKLKKYVLLWLDVDVIKLHIISTGRQLKGVSAKTLLTPQPSCLEPKTHTFPKYRYFNETEQKLTELNV